MSFFRRNLIFAAFILWMTGIPSVSSAGSLPLATGEWVPFTSREMDHYGKFTKRVSIVFQEMGIDPVYRFYPWQRCFDAVLKGRVWAAFPYSYTEDRAKKVWFSDMISCSKTLFFYYDKEGASYDVRTPEDLKAYALGGVRGYYYEEFFTKQGFDVDYANKEINAVEKLRLGRIDLLPMNELVGRNLIETRFKEDAQRFKTLSVPLSVNTLCLVVSKTYPGSEKFLKAFNKALSSCVEKGLLEIDPLWIGIRTDEMTGSKNPSLSKNLTASLVVVVVILSVMFMGIYYYQASRNASQQLEKMADKYIHSIAGTLEVPLWDMDRENINTVCNYYIQNEWVVKVKLTGISGEVMFEKRIQDNGAVVNRSRVISHEGEVIGSVEIALSALELNKDKLSSLRVVIAGLLICVAGLVLFTGFLLQKLIKEPLAVLGEIAESYSRGNYRPQIDFTPHKEFDTVVSALFKMGETIESQLNELKHAEESLKKHRDSLEETVAERTMALKFSNEKLHTEVAHRKQAQKELKMNEKRLEAILRSSPVGIGLVVDGRLAWANETLSLMVGYEEEDLLGKAGHVLFEDAKEYDRCVAALGKNISQSFSNSVETRWIRKDRTVFDCNIRAYPLDVDDPSKGQIFAVADISDRKSSEQALREKDRLQGVLELSGAISHEMNQPLMSALGYFDLLALDMDADDPGQAHIEKIRTQLERMSDITKKLMEISRYQTKEYLDGRILDLSKSSDTDAGGK